MNESRDTLVGDALRRFDVLDHAPDFWTALEARLGEDGSTDTDDPPTDAQEAEATVVDLQDSPTARRAAQRNRTPMRALVAAVAVVVAVVVGVSVLGGGGDDESQLDAADDPTEAPETSDPDVTPPPREDDASTETAAPPETTTTMVGEQSAPEEAATGWLDALAAGESDAAYELLDEQSKADLSRNEFADLSSGLSEGAAAFAGDGIERSVRDGDGFSVVTFAGDVEREGMIETAAYPVVVTASGVHFTLDGPHVDLDPGYAQGSGTTLASPLELVVQEEADAWIWIDDGDATPLAGRGDVSVDVEAEAGAGTHVATIVAIEGGRITARSYTVVVP
jgi:hypothetical protein